MLDNNTQRGNGMGSWSLDMRSGRLAWSEVTCNLFGITPAEFRETVEHFRSFILPEDLPAYDAVHTRVSPSKPFWEANYRIRRPDGMVRWMYQCGNVQFDAGGAAVSRVGMVLDITEQRAVREQLERNTTLLRIAGKAALLGGWTIELPERKLTWSDETCLIHDLLPGYKPTLREGISMFPDECREEVVRRVEKCARDGTPYDIEVPKITATGRRIWVRCIGQAVRDADGKIIRLQGAFQDITSRKQVELELARSNRALHMLNACSDALIHINDEAKLLTEICRLAVELGGYRMAWVGYARQDEHCTIQPMAHAGAESGYLSVARLNWSEHELAGRGPAGQAIRTGQLAVCADVASDDRFLRWRDEALSRGFKSIICLPLCEENRAFGLLGLYSADINDSGADELKLLQRLADNLALGIGNLRAHAERRQAQREIARQAELIALATDAIFVRDLQNRINFWSKGAERIFGWKAAEIIGQSAQESLCVDPFAHEIARRTLLEKGEWHGELQKKTRTGEGITVDCRWTLMRDQHGEPNSILAIETDVTEKKKHEAHFYHAQRMESIGTLAGGIAHDLNNVLAPIMISLQMLKRNATDSDTSRMLETLETCTKRGAELVKQVLSFARGIAGQRVMVNLKQLVKELQQVMREVFPKSITFEFTAADDVWTVTGDPTQLHQVFLNLCVNARDAMPRGGRLVISMENVVFDAADAALHPDSKTGAYVVASVMDSGTGISPAIRDRIFEPFFTTKQLGGGTGLGLSTALGIVKGHGGFIQVESEPGKGTKFKVHLPANPSTRPKDVVAVEPSGLPRGHGELILLVDDEQSIRDIAQKILEKFGYRVLCAANGEEAVGLYTRHQRDISLVLTDMSMPVMDGSVLIRTLKSINPQVCIIASSGLATSDEIDMIQNPGDLAFIPKPYAAETLLKVLHEELAARKRS